MDFLENGLKKRSASAADTNRSLHFAAAAAAPWGCGGLWWSVKHCGVGCPMSRLIHLKLDETADISHSFGTEGLHLNTLMAP